MSPHMKLGNKPNKTGTKKMEVGPSFVYFFFHVHCCKSVRWEVFPKKTKNLHWDFHQPVSRMLTEGHGHCFEISVGEADGDTIAPSCLRVNPKSRSAVASGRDGTADILHNSQA